ncbi:homeobox protein vex1-like [Etheostoma cragini]|uniref:homeobox protein vex1-like n=1 Tax=Etheostoma cragini TaxID=417921 RepID=UPI00155EF63E|nr:homeobox protein vex1-like [Etheostoma cragini]
MRGCFSIEWMAQSSQQPAGTETASASGPGPGPGPAACGTYAESLPGFYCRQKCGNGAQQKETQIQDLDAFSPRPRQHRASLKDPATEAGFSSGTEEETSGYESEEGQSLSPPAPADCPSPPSPASGRRPRTAFTAEQISSLEKAFKRNAYLGTQDKADLCRKLSLSDKQT